MTDTQKGGAAAPPKTHNSDPHQQVKMIADRIARLTEEKVAIANDIKDIYVEAKGAGYDVPALRDAVKWALMDMETREKAVSREETRDTYLASIGHL